MRPALRSFALASVLATLVTHPSRAQSSAIDRDTDQPKVKRSSKRDKSDRRWKVLPALDLEAAFDNNVFLLESNKRDNLESPSAAELTSGRYSNMESASDLMMVMTAGAAIEGPGLLGKALSVSPEVTYNRYAQNAERSNLSVGLTIEEDFGADRRLRLRGIMTPSYFAKNYLSNATDLDASGTISDNERLYVSGEYSEQQVTADYRFRLTKSAQRRFGAAIQLGGGYYNRGYRAPFAGRDVHGPTVGARLLMDLSRRVSLDVDYGFEALSGTPTDQVMLLDEPDFGQDLNGNGSQTDLDTRVVALVDPSRDEHSLGAEIGFELGKKTNLRFGYEHRWRRYHSEQPMDVGHIGRRDGRDRASASFRHRLKKGIGLRLGVSGTVQDLNRTGDPGSTGEISDYSRFQMDFGFAYQL